MIEHAEGRGGSVMAECGLTLCRRSSGRRAHPRKPDSQSRLTGNALNRLAYDGCKNHLSGIGRWPTGPLPGFVDPIAATNRLATDGADALSACKADSPYLVHIVTRSGVAPSDQHSRRAGPFDDGNTGASRVAAGSFIPFRYAIRAVRRPLSAPGCNNRLAVGRRRHKEGKCLRPRIRSADMAHEMITCSRVESAWVRWTFHRSGCNPFSNFSEKWNGRLYDEGLKIERSKYVAMILRITVRSE
jgi:hypothetical protein